MMITSRYLRPVKIATVDDHPLTRFALKTLISDQSEWNIVAECESPEDFLSVIDLADPNIVIIDLLFANESGIDLLEHLNAFYPDIHTIIYSMREERHYAQRCFHAGARGYVCKNEPLTTIVMAMKKVLSGQRYVSKELSGAMMMDIKSGTRLDGLDQLSNRELEVFQYIGSGMNTQQIAESICRSPKTVETYRYRIKKKLGLTNSVELAQFACIHTNGWEKWEK